MRAAGVNPVETYIRAGTYAKLPSLPYTPGGEGTGDVEAVGEGVIKFKVRMIFYCYDNWYSMLTIFLQPGDRVYMAGTKTGTYAEYCLALDTTVYPLPENTSYEGGAALGVAYATAHRVFAPSIFSSRNCLVGR